MDGLFFGFSTLSLLLVIPAVAVYRGLTKRVELLPSSPSQPSSAPLNAPTAVEKHEPEQPVTEPPTQERSIRTVLHITSNSERRDSLSSTSQSPSVLPVHSGGSSRLENYESGQSLTESAIPEQLKKTMIRTLILDIVGNPAQSELATKLRDDDAQCLTDYLDQLLSARNPLNSKQKKDIFDLLSTIVKSARVFPAAYELSDVACTFTQPHTQGRFSNTYKGTYEGQQVCVKAIRRYKHQDEAQGCLVQERAKELILWSHLFHPNVLPFLGVFLSNEESPRVCLVSLWMKNGDLSHFLKRFPEIPRLPFNLGIASGLRHLHEHGIIHGDLRTETVLVSDDKRPVIADTGFSEVAMTMDQEGNVSNTTRWMAPELLCEDSPQTTQSDVWSLGCIFYEVLTGNVPFANMKGHQLVTALARGHITPLTDVAEEESERQGITPPFRDILVKCWQQGPQQRPTVKELCRAVVRIGTVDDNTTVDYRPQFLINARLSEERAHQQQLYCILSRITQPSAETIEENSNESTSGSEDNTHRTLAKVPYSPVVDASMPASDGIPTTDDNTANFSTTSRTVHSPASSVRELEMLLSTHGDVGMGRARTLSGPIPDEHSDLFMPAWENFISADTTPVDLVGKVERKPTLFPAHCGGYSDIYIGYLNPPFTGKVSIKVLRTNDQQKEIERIKTHILWEAVICRRLKHENILPFYGIATDLGPREDCPALIAAYCDNGNAELYIHHQNLTIENQFFIISGASRGLRYLHEQGIVHGNLKPSNILIGDDHQPLLSGFGRSRILDARGLTTKPAGTVRYQARELLEGSAVPNHSTDVCAFGLTAYKLWTKVPPYAGVENGNDNALQMRIIVDRIQQQRPNPAPPMADNIWPILAPCLSHEPNDRPDIATITESLELLPRRRPIISHL